MPWINALVKVSRRFNPVYLADSTGCWGSGIHRLIVGVCQGGSRHTTQVTAVHHHHNNIFVKVWSRVLGSVKVREVMVGSVDT